MVDGEPIAAIAEERLNRVKYFAGFPKLSILRCLEVAGLSFSDIDAVAVGRDSSANLSKKLEFAVRNPSSLLNLAKIRKKFSKIALNLVDPFLTLTKLLAMQPQRHFKAVTLACN